jgi:para-aminobenzoate synthetase component I
MCRSSASLRLGARAGTAKHCPVIHLKLCAPASPCMARHGPNLPPFRGGAAGFFAYELNRALEQLPVGQGVPQSVLNFFDVVIVYDHYESRRLIVSTGWPERDPIRRSERARRRADELTTLLERRISSAPPWRNAIGVWNSNFSR